MCSIYTLTPRNVLEEFASATGRLQNGYQALKRIDSLQVGTAGKEKVWRKDNVDLYHYTPSTQRAVRTPVLMVYALVNRHHMMDIQPDRSFIRNLQSVGLDLYLIDWGSPAPEDRYCTMHEYINGYLNDAIDVVRRRTGHSAVTLMGICQGGTFSVIYAALHPQKVRNLITLVTPVDFHTPNDLLSVWARHLDVDALVDRHGNVPGSLLNAGFEMLKPLRKTSKYIAMLNSVDKEAQLMNFLRMEYWIADSPSQAGECFRQFIRDLYQENRLVKGTMQLGNKQVNLRVVDMPLLNIYAAEDYLVPPESSIALNDLVGSADKCLTRFAGGHIGVFVGSRSQKELAPGIGSWLQQRDADV